MTSIVKLQTLSGAHNEAPPCYILQVDEFRFLLDCGWDEMFNMTYIKELKKHLYQIDAVLLSYPDIAHLGALPYLVGKCGLRCPIYATIPVYKMGQMFMYDLYQSKHNSQEFDLFTLDDIDAAFDKITQLKYSQTVHLKGKGHGLLITPLPAGHMIGGTLWKIVKDGEEEIVYAIDYNHKKERHLNGCILENLARPSLMITDAYNASYVQSRRKARDEQLMTTIINTLRGDGNVLIAVDTAGRVLELAQLLDTMWRTPEAMLATYSLALLNNVSFNVVEFAKSQMEWMSDKIMRSFEDNRNNPFQFKHLKLCHNLAELQKVVDPKLSAERRFIKITRGNSKTNTQRKPVKDGYGLFALVVLASVPDLECGFSRDLFVAWCGNAKNSIVLTNRSSPDTLGRWLIDNPDQKSVTMEVRRRVKLEGSELDNYMKKKQEKEATEARLQEQAKKDIEDESSDDSDVEIDMESPNLPTVAKGRHDLMLKAEGKSRSGFFKQAKKSYPMFPFHEERIKWDDYGEIIRAEDFSFMDSLGADEEIPTKTKEPGTHVEEDAMQDISEVPTKFVSATVTLDVNASIVFIDFEGRSDGESIRKILAQIKPRQLILVHGTTESTESLADYCQSTSGLLQGNVFAPRELDVVDATRESFIYQVKLKDSLVTSLNFFKARDAELAWLDSRLDFTHAKTDTSAVYKPYDVTDSGGKDDKWKEKNGDSAAGDLEADLVPALDIVPPTQVVSHRSVFINEPKLSDFKYVLIKEGIQAEFVAGVLICNNTVAVKKNEAGRIQLEGCMCDDYYRIRDLLYGQYAIV